MGRRTNEIDAELHGFIERQPMFFVASAPLASEGRVNVSPKGLDTFRILGPRQVAYLDLSGSGNETATHVGENGRLTVMFCSFAGDPQIVRIYCAARVVTPASEEWPQLQARFPAHRGARRIVVGEVDEVQTSCGHMVPEMAFVTALR